MATVDERLAERIAATTRRLGLLKARELLREMRAADRQRSSERRALARRRSALGDAVVQAGCGEWLPAEITGVLLDARDRIGGSSTQRLGMRKRGEAHRESGGISVENGPAVH
jgi:hypothetical protein